jgi:hypothetical protein
VSKELLGFSMGLFGWLDQQKRLNDLEEQVRKLVRIVEARDLDWVDMRARCKRLLDRTEKAQRALNPAVDSEDADANNGSGGVIATNRGLLTDRQKLIQQQILKRRAGG